jgi:thiamine biosynthesis lipoprotein
MKQIVALFLVMLFTTADVIAQWVDHRFPLMGTEIRVRFWLADAEQADRARQAVIDEMHHINNTMSPWIETSILSVVNREAAKKPVPVTKEFFKVIEDAIKISEMTQGAFDITFSSVGYLYDYRAGQKPSDQQLTEKVPLVNYRSLQLDKDQLTIRYLAEGVKIDLGGIAKGLAVDNSIRKLQSFGVTEASVTAGGDTYVLGDNAGRLWRVGIRHPRADNKVVTVLPVANMAISTSGDYERYFIDENGERHHHILNPRTGKSVKGIQSVTIMAANSTFADALSTSVFVLGVKDGLDLVNKLEDVSAIIVDDSGKMFTSNDLASPD